MPTAATVNQHKIQLPASQGQEITHHKFYRKEQMKNAYVKLREGFLGLGFISIVMAKVTGWHYYT